MIDAIFLWLVMPVAILNAGALHGAQFWAEHRRRSGESPPDLPNFMTYFDLIGVRRLYSDLHREYGSRFISRCVHIARVTVPLTVALLLGWGLAVVASGG
jgi:hypothetical protein